MNTHVPIAQAALYRISEAVQTTNDLDELYQSIHTIIGELTPAKNFYIAVYDAQANMIDFPYHVDEYDPIWPPQKMTNDLTSYVIRTGKPLLADPAVFKQLVINQEVASYGEESIDWLGVPLKIQNSVIGMIALQTYSPEVRYSLDDLEILSFVSTQVALAIERKRSVDALRESEERYRLLFENTPVGSFLAKANGEIIDVNPTAVRILGSPSREATKTINVLEYAPLIEAGFSSDFQRCIDTQTQTEAQFAYTTRWGKSIFVNYHLTPICDPEGCTDLVQVLFEDITERKQAENEIKQLTQDLEIRAEQFALLYEAGLTINSTLEPRKQLETLCITIMLALHADHCGFFSVNEAKAEVYFEFGVGQGADLKSLHNLRAKIGDAPGLIGIVAQSQQALYIPDVKLDPRWIVTDPNLRSALWMPVLRDGHLLGILSVVCTRANAFSEQDQSLLELLANQVAVSMENSRLFNQMQATNLELIRAYDSTIEGWSRTLEMRDRETRGHSERVTRTSLLLAREMGMGEEELVHFRRGVLLHDIGKMAIPDSILFKPSQLNEDEWIIMRQHPAYAYQLLSGVPFLSQALDIPYSHHERWDGKGYPRGLKGEEIPIGARIFAVVDVWDALMYERPYRPRWIAETVRTTIAAQSGMHFDPQVVEVFLRLLDNGQLDPLE